MACGTKAEERAWREQYGHMFAFTDCCGVQRPDFSELF